MVEQKEQKMYVLGMFPYPSGEGLHVGHVRIYTAVDVMARYFRMKGYEVLHPTGWDAFGLPAENAAIKRKKNPMEMVPKNEENFKRQMQELHLDFDWERTFSTTDPDYYGITQWIFLKLYNKKNERGERLIYRDDVPINWCPSCKTGLANEEVLPDGTHERCGNPVEKRDMPQWVMRITEYADKLLKDLDEVEWKDEEGKEHKGLDWPKGILEMQRNWIGRKEGAVVKFALRNMEVQGEGDSTERYAHAFTTRLDTIYGATFMVIAPEVVKRWMGYGWKPSGEVVDYVEKSLKKTAQQRLEGMGEKSGVDVGIKAVNPLNGQEIPVFVADYVMADVGTGVVMGVPAHDERDFEFAKKHDLPIVEVVETDGDVSEGPTEEYGVLTNSGEYDGLASEEAKDKILADLKSKGFAESEVTYHLRDWVFSRQRYWGEPIPLVYCEKCGDENGVVPMNEEDLPLKLPLLKSYEPTGTGESPLARAEEWVKTRCPKCGGEARRETDTMPNWAGSCWYFLAFPFWNQVDKPRTLDDTQVQNQVEKWMPVDWYLGGAEHAVLHLLYARFWVKALYDLGILKFTEPFMRLRSVGMVLAEDGRKMSKSWGNVINPDDMVKKFGADAVRLYEMFMGPWDQAISWDTRTLVGQVRFINRLKEAYAEKSNWGSETTPELKRELYKLLHRFEKAIPEQRFNTAIASVMEFVNAWREEGKRITREDGEVLAAMLYPFVPALAGELWRELTGSEPEEWVWPEVGEVEFDEAIIEVVVQVNGKVRGSLEMENGKARVQEEVEDAARKDEKIAKWLEGKEHRVVFVPGKLINFVTGS